MIHFERDTTIAAAPDAVWAVLGDFMRIDVFAPEIVSVDALTEGENGLGSKRRNNFKNGSSMVEEVTEWEPGRRYRVRLSEMSSMPLHEAYSAVSVEPAADGHSLVTWDMDYRVEYGPVGWLLGQTAMKLMMGKIIDGNLSGLADRLRRNR